jgi:DnaK suppressor protein
MPKKNELKTLRALLLRRRDALRQAIAGDLSLLQQLRNETGDVFDAALDNSHEEISSQMVEVESRELVHIQNALERIDLGTYGRCEMCEGVIPKARLEVLPYATMCIKCQRQAEQTRLAGGRSTDWSNLVDLHPADEARVNDIDFNVS